MSIRAIALLQQLAAVLAILAIVSSFVPAAAASSAAQASVVATNFSVHSEFTPTDTYYPLQWGLPAIGAPNAWDVTLGSRSVVVAVVDTGVYWTQPDIQGNMWTNPIDGTHGYDFVDMDTNPTEVDPSGLYHGTGVAGIVAAITNNALDIAGTAQVSLMAVRALGSNGQGSSLNVSRAIRWAADHNAKVINLSLGTNQTFPGTTDLQLAIDYAWSKGALIVAAAGNGGADGIGDPVLDYPASLPNVVSVAAIDQSGRRASFSNYGPGLQLSAPGDNIWTLSGGGAPPHTLRGTSFSTPFVTAAAALLLSRDRNLTNIQLRNILNQSAVQPGGGTGTYNTNYGWGVVNIWNAFNALNQPFISVDAYPTTVSRSSTFGITWSILGPGGLTVTDTHVVWGTSSGRLGNATSALSGVTRQSYTANGLSLPSGAGAMYFKVVATVNGTQYQSPERVIGVSNLPDFLYVLYQLLASNLLFLALFILALAGVVAFLPQRRAAKARRARAAPRTMYPPSYYVNAVRPTEPPPASQPSRTATSATEPPTVSVPAAVPAQAPHARSTAVPMAPPAAPAKKRCPKCGTMVNADNLFCFFCGNPFR